MSLQKSLSGVCLSKAINHFLLRGKKSRDSDKVDQHQRKKLTKMKNKKYFLLLWCLVYFLSIAQLGHTKLGKKHINDKIVKQDYLR